MKRTFLSIVAALFMTTASQAQQILPYQDVTLTPEQRAEDLIKRLTIEEKTQLTANRASWHSTLPVVERSAAWCGT